GALLRGLRGALENLRLSLVEPEECGAMHSELSAWARDFNPQDRFHLLRIQGTLSRTRRLAESYADRINRLFPPRAEELGRALGHPVPHLSHLGVRARQARVPFAACADGEHLRDFTHLVGKTVRLRVTPEGLSLQETAPDAGPGQGRQPTSPVSVPQVALAA